MNIEAIKFDKISCKVETFEDFFKTFPDYNVVSVDGKSILWFCQRCNTPIYNDQLAKMIKGNGEPDKYFHQRTEDCVYKLKITGKEADGS